MCDKEESRVQVLFDTGSHKTFITGKAIGRLGLEITRKKRLEIKVFGRNDAEVELRDVVGLSLKDLRGVGKGIEAEAFVVDNIAEISNIHIEIVKKQYPYSKDLYFSDISDNESALDVQCLMGSDFFWCFQTGELKRGDPGEPVAVKTFIRWVLSGPIKGERLNSITPCNVNLLIDSTALMTWSDSNDLKTQVEKLWDLDSIGIRDDNEVYAM